MSEPNEDPLREIREVVAKVGRQLLGDVFNPPAPKGGKTEAEVLELNEEIARLKRVQDQLLTDVKEKSEKITDLLDKNRTLRAHVKRLEGKSTDED